MQNSSDNNAEAGKISFTGLLAQEVDKAAQKINYNFSGVDKTGAIMGLRYSEFVVPLIKSVQELSQQNENMKKEYDEKINNMQKQIDALLLLISNKTTSNNQIKNLVGASISQNVPNPFNQNTSISYLLPEKFSNAQIIITAENGTVIKSVKITGAGKGSLNIDAATLSSGAYNYSLIIDGKLIDTKKMMLNN